MLVELWNLLPCTQSLMLPFSCSHSVLQLSIDHSSQWLGMSVNANISLKLGRMRSVIVLVFLTISYPPLVREDISWELRNALGISGR